MTELWVDAAEGQMGRMPARCVKTGERCISRSPLIVSDLSPAVEWLTWSGLWPRSRGATQRRVVVSILPGRQRTLAALAQVRDLTSVLLLPLLAVVLLTDVTFAIRLLQATVMVKAVVAAVGIAWAPHARADAAGDWVHIRRIHRDAAEAAQQVMTQPDSTPAHARAMSLSAATSAIARDGG